MVHSLSRWLMPVAFRAAALSYVVFATAAHAQPAGGPARPDPLDAKASIPALAYASPFSQYRRPGDEKLISWRDANDTVARIGGWRAYAREAQQPEPAPAAKPPAATPAATPSEMAKPMPMPQGHGGHKTP